IHDPAAARNAAEYFTRAERDAASDEFAATAKHNRQIALLLTAQATPLPADANKSLPIDQGAEHAPRSQDQSADAAESANKAAANSQSGASQAKPKPGYQAVGTNERAPGAGTMPAVPDGDDASPLPPELAREHLRLAAERIHEEGVNHRRQAKKSPAPGTRDW
ncbi:MAG: hypothetical protein ACRD36_12825, partial [Candidatus Acidiferrum sp.]